MRIHQNIEIRGLYLYLIQEKVLILSDPHIGYEEAMQRRGVLIPNFQFSDLKKNLLPVLGDVTTVVINGDFKHEFGTILYSERKQTKWLLDLFQGKRIIFIQGNHDKILKSLVPKMEITDHVQFGKIVICHGDVIKDIDCDVIIIGHEHVAIELKEGSRVEKFKCFLKGGYNGKVLIAMPSCNPLTTGTDMLREQRLSPYLQQNLDAFEVYVVSEKIYNFGRVKDLL